MLARDKLQFHKTPIITNRSCTLMLLSNLREPDWISVPCDKKLVNTVICKIQKETKDRLIIDNLISSEFHLCQLNTILVNVKCYAFLWGSYRNMSGQFCSDYKARGVSSTDITHIYNILNAVSSVNMFPMLFLQNKGSQIIIQIYKLFGKLRLHHVSVQNSTLDGFYICTFHQKKIIIGINMFHCQKGGYILHKYTCDGIKDCPNDNSDELSCICEKEYFDSKHRSLCMQIKSVLKIPYCTSKYYVDLKGICKKYDFKKVGSESGIHYLAENKIKEKFLCHNGKALDVLHVNDLVSDCGPESEDEPVLLSLKAKLKTFKCKPWEIPCMEGHTKCFNFTDTCLYELNTESHMIPCRNGGHLDNCKKFECNAMFKCPDSYCVPWTYVCDGKWDCPFGEDEERNKVCIGEIVCEGMFKCSHERHKCISLGNVCDNKLDCLLHDDELFCELSLFKCPVSCNCLIYAITCFSLSNNIEELDFSNSLLSLSVYKSKIVFFHMFEQKLKNMQFIKLNVNNIISICPLLFLKHVLLLNVAENHITTVKQNCFSVSTFLKSLNLSSNHVMHINTFAFHNLYHLRYIDLSNNPFINLPSQCFSNLMVLRVLNLENIKLRIVKTNFSIQSI